MIIKLRKLNPELETLKSSKAFKKNYTWRLSCANRHNARVFEYADYGILSDTENINVYAD